MLGITSTSKDAIKVRTSNGQKINSPWRSRDRTLKMQGNVFKVDLYIMPLAGCDVVLGIQWLRVLGPILWDFDNLNMVFQYGTMRCKLKGLQQGPQLSLMDGNSFRWLKKGNEGVLLQLIGIDNHAVKESNSAKQVQN